MRAGVYLAMRCLLSPGDVVLTTYPAYQSLYEVAASLGCSIRHWEPAATPPGADGRPGGFAFDVKHAAVRGVRALRAFARDGWCWLGLAHDPLHVARVRAVHRRLLLLLLECAQALIRPGVKLVVVNFPHNPTGATLSRSDFAALIELCRAAGCHLFSDESVCWACTLHARMQRSHSTLPHTQNACILTHAPPVLAAVYRLSEPEAPLPSAADLYDKAVALWGLSKSWGLPGLRLGWLASKDAELLQAVLANKDFTTICQPGPSEVGGATAAATAACSPRLQRMLPWHAAADEQTCALRHRLSRTPDQVLALAAVRATPLLTGRCRDIIATNLALADAFFGGRWAGVFEWLPPRAGPVAFPRVKTGEPVDAWCEALVAEAGVLLLPASVYDHEPSRAAGHFRIGLGRSNFSECLRQLDAWLVKRYGEPAP